MKIRIAFAALITGLVVTAVACTPDQIQTTVESAFPSASSTTTEETTTTQVADTTAAPETTTTEPSAPIDNQAGRSGTQAGTSTASAPAEAGREPLTPKPGSAATTTTAAPTTTLATVIKANTDVVVGRDVKAGIYAGTGTECRWGLYPAAGGFLQSPEDFGAYGQAVVELRNGDRFGAMCKMTLGTGQSGDRRTAGVQYGLSSGRWQTDNQCGFMAVGSGFLRNEFDGSVSIVNVSDPYQSAKLFDLPGGTVFVPSECGAITRIG